MKGDVKMVKILGSLFIICMGAVMCFGGARGLLKALTKLK